MVARLGEMGVAAMNGDVGFPMEVTDIPARTWAVAHKPLAEAPGMGCMSLHRIVIHPRFGSFILLNTVKGRGGSHGEDAPLDYNPCLGCKLCVAACPMGPSRRMATSTRWRA